MIVAYVLGSILSLILLVLIAAAIRPGNFRISRSISIHASARILFPYINSMTGFQQWNPYKEKDPATHHEISGPDEGPGSCLRWSGNANVGAGIMTILRCEADQQVEIDLEFLKPFPGHNLVRFSLTPKGDETLMTWDMSGRYAFFPKVVGLFISMDKMIGSDFENGLRKLKSLAESQGF